MSSLEELQQLINERAAESKDATAYKAVFYKSMTEQALEWVPEPQRSIIIDTYKRVLLELGEQDKYIITKVDRK